MGHGKETPRQKMIGMMYLVLTALLALNVSAEVLNAFILVDKSLRKTSDNFQKKNDDVYTKFQAAYELNKNKVEPWKKKADEVKKSSQELFDYMTKIQEEIVLKADGPKSTYPQKGPDAIQSKDDNNIPGEIMILKKKGEELKESINKYKEKLISLIDNKEKDKNIVEGIKNNLNTDDITGNDGLAKPWHIANFDQLPLVGVITMLSKMKADIRNAEADMISFLITKIDAASFKFNKLEAIVNAPTNYCLVGEKYEAQVFIAASDSTQAPDITVSGSGKLPIKEGKGIYTGGTGGIGIKQWGGVIKVVSPATGDTLKYPFKSEYTVAAPSISVSPTKMNVFYIGVPNPVDITASGVPADKVVVTLSGAGGNITPKGEGKYEVMVKQTGKVTINVSAKMENGTKNLGSKEFRVKVVPDPIATVGTNPVNMKGGLITINEMSAQTGVKALLENFDFDLNFQVTGFTVSATIKGFEQEAKANSASFTAEQKQLIRTAGTGKKIYVEDIQARGPDGSIRKLGSLSFKLK